jgi:hypothetical protein
VREWRFAPAGFMAFEPGEDYDGDGTPDFKRVKVQTPLAVYVDLRFDFDIVEGKGVVTGGFPSAPTP